MDVKGVSNTLHSFTNAGAQEVSKEKSLTFFLVTSEVRVKYLREKQLPSPPPPPFYHTAAATASSAVTPITASSAVTAAELVH